MKKRILSVFLILAMLTGLFAVLPVVVVADTPTVWDGSTAAAFAGGDGTEANPYQISNGAELALMSQKITVDKDADYYRAYYQLTADIVLNTGDATEWGSSAPANSFTPIGTWNNATSSFGGHFDGQGHTISGLYISSENDGLGLFGVIQGGAEIKNFALVNSYVAYTGSAKEAEMGAVIGQTDRQNEGDITISNVYADAIVISTKNEVGGIIGNLSHSQDSPAYNAGKVYLDKVTFIGSVSAGNYAAGLIGNARNVKLEATNCLVYADIIATSTDNGQYSAGFFARSNSSLAKLGSSYQQVATNCIFAGKSVAASKSAKYNRAYISSSNGTNKPLAQSCYNAVPGLSTMRNADTDDDDAPSADIAMEQLYGYYDGADAIDWTEWAANWASPADDIIRPKGVAENFDIALFTMSLQDGAAVRLADPAGLRFTAKISKNYLASFTSVTSYGIVIAPTAFVTTAGDFTMAALDAIDVPAGSAKFLKIEAEKLVKETGNYVEFTGVIANIKADNYAVDFSAIVYVEADGQVYYSAYDAEENSRSIRDIATAAYNDLSDTQTGEYQFAVDDKFSPYTAGQRAILNGFMG